MVIDYVPTRDRREVYHLVFISVYHIFNFFYWIYFIFSSMYYSIGIIIRFLIKPIFCRFEEIQLKLRPNEQPLVSVKEAETTVIIFGHPPEGFHPDTEVRWCFAQRENELFVKLYVFFLSCHIDHLLGGLITLLTGYSKHFITERFGYITERLRFSYWTFSDFLLNIMPYYWTKSVWSPLHYWFFTSSNVDLW